MFLTSSITTMKAIRATGVPWGNRWDNVLEVFFSQPYMLIESQKVKDKGRVTDR